MGKQRRLATVVICTRRGAYSLEVLMQVKRKYGKWEFVGGKLDGEETIEECAKRELKEEVGLTAVKLDFLTYVDTEDEARYCCMVFHAKMLNVLGHPVIMEPEKHPVLGWVPFYTLPTELTRNCQAVLDCGVIDLIRASYDLHVEK